MRKFLEGLVIVIADIALGIFWSTVMIFGVLAVWFILYMLVTGFMR